MKRWSGVAFGILTVGLLAGCSPETVESAKKDVERNTEAVRTGAEKVERAAKPVIDVAKPVLKPVVDAAGKEINKKTEQLKIGGRVTVALQANESLPKTIRVDADPDGQGVKLRGTVKTVEQKKLAERIARDTLGKEKKVQNDLKIGDPEKETPGPADAKKATEKKS